VLIGVGCFCGNSERRGGNVLDPSKNNKISLTNRPQSLGFPLNYGPGYNAAAT
jgi:hypothetical protein